MLAKALQPLPQDRQDYAAIYTKKQIALRDYRSPSSKEYWLVERQKTFRAQLIESLKDVKSELEKEFISEAESLAKREQIDLTRFGELYEQSITVSRLSDQPGQEPANAIKTSLEVVLGQLWARLTAEIRGNRWLSTDSSDHEPRLDSSLDTLKAIGELARLSNRDRERTTLILLEAIQAKIVRFKDIQTDEEQQVEALEMYSELLKDLPPLKATHAEKQAVGSSDPWASLPSAVP
jgi:hypothetical protein